MNLLSLLETQDILLTKYKTKNKIYILKKLKPNYYLVCLLDNKQFKMDITYIKDKMLYNNNAIKITANKKSTMAYVENNFNLVQNMTDWALKFEKIDCIINIKEIYNLLKMD
jgi:hypothetical protein